MAVIRTFIAVPVPPDVVRAAVDARARCAGLGDVVRWVPPERIHLTLKFLGDIDPDRVAAVGRVLAEAATAARQFHLATGGLGVFPTVKRPRVLWMAVTGDTVPLIAFARKLDARLAALGFPAETRPFRAHLTLGRFKGKTDPRRLADTLLATARIGATAFSAAQVILFQSELKPSGAVYTPLAAYSLTDGDEFSRAPGRYS